MSLAATAADLSAYQQGHARNAGPRLSKAMVEMALWDRAEPAAGRRTRRVRDHVDSGVSLGIADIPTTLETGASRVANIGVSRVGGHATARAIDDLCARL